MTYRELTEDGVREYCTCGVLWTDRHCRQQNVHSLNLWYYDTKFECGNMLDQENTVQFHKLERKGTGQTLIKQD
jgi:hypothetical protein